MRRSSLAERKYHDQPHSDAVMEHACVEKKTVVREIDYFTYVFNVKKAGVEGPDV